MDRFWSKVDKTGDCWLWTAARYPQGYGAFRLGDGMRYSHRVSWTLSVGEIPEGMHVLHKCDNPPCVNPKHLFLGTVLDNMRDRDAKGRNGKLGKGQPSLVCRRGHPKPPGQCKICKNARARELRARRSGRYNQ